VTDAKNVCVKVPSLMGDIAFCQFIFTVMPQKKDLISKLKDDIMDSSEFSESIYSLEMVESTDTRDIVNLSLIGYTKTLTNNKIFKFNDFLKYFKYLSNNMNVVVKDYFKKEAYILREGKLKTPLDIV
jgi:hypothetical protein